MFILFISTRNNTFPLFMLFLHKKPIRQYNLIMGTYRQLCFINNSSNVTQDSLTNIIIIDKQSTGKYDVLGYNKHYFRKKHHYLMTIHTNCYTTLGSLSSFTRYIYYQYVRNVHTYFRLVFLYSYNTFFYSKDSS